jgi:hypothetical protein
MEFLQKKLPRALLIFTTLIFTHLVLIFTTQVAEGYATAFSLMEFLQKKLPRSFRMDLKFPILFGVAQVLKGERRHIYLVN